jgi:hypothetical protein
MGGLLRPPAPQQLADALGRVLYETIEDATVS